MSRVKLLLDVAEDLRNLADSLRAVADAFSCHESEDPPAETPPEPPARPEQPKEDPVTLEQLRTRLGELSREGYTAQIRDLIGKYGATHLSKVDPKDYAALLRDAEETRNAS